MIIVLEMGEGTGISESPTGIEGIYLFSLPHILNIV